MKLNCVSKVCSFPQVYDVYLQTKCCVLAKHFFQMASGIIKADNMFSRARNPTSYRCPRVTQKVRRVSKISAVSPDPLTSKQSQAQAASHNSWGNLDVTAKTRS